MEETAYTLPFPKRNCGEKETTNYCSKYWTLRAGIFEMLLRNRASEIENENISPSLVGNWPGVFHGRVQVKNGRDKNTLFTSGYP